MHNEAYFPEPFWFRTDIWLDEEDGKESRRTIRKGFAPFSLGESACLGKATAFLETSLTVEDAVAFRL